MMHAKAIAKWLPMFLAAIVTHASTVTLSADPLKG